MKKLFNRIRDKYLTYLYIKERRRVESMRKFALDLLLDYREKLIGNIIGGYSPESDLGDIIDQINSTELPI